MVEIALPGRLVHSLNRTHKMKLNGRATLPQRKWLVMTAVCCGVKAPTGKLIGIVTAVTPTCQLPSENIEITPAVEFLAAIRLAVEPAGGRAAAARSGACQLIIQTQK